MASSQDIDFEELVEQAIRSIPTAFMERIGNLAILIEDSPNAEDLSMMDRSPGSVIYGLYIGVPVKLGRAGVEQVIEIELTEEEQAAIDRSAASVRELTQKIGV